MSSTERATLAALPSVDRVLRFATVAALVEEHGRAMVLTATRDALAELRGRLAAGGAQPFDDTTVGAAVARHLALSTRVSLGPVFNLTGTVLHTNLGRAPLPPEAIQAMARAAGAANLEYELADGRRGERDHHVEGWLRRLTGAAAAIVVNNNAAAVLLVLNTLALGKEVPVSRGELIEIGGAFRMPDIMARAGAILREVGTTNRTHLGDFAAAIGPGTAMLLAVHTSNYAIQGFTATVAEHELATLAHRHDLPFAVDLGSGALVDLARFGLPHEPTPMAALAEGADLVTFSGDKLLGGPQAGIIVGRKDLIDRLKKNPLKRALRLDKITLAALEAVLGLYGDPDRLRQRLPTLRLLTRSLDEISLVAQRVAPAVQARLAPIAAVDIIACQSQIGSGAMPVDLLASMALAIRPLAGGRAVAELAAEFRRLPIPVIGRIHDNALIFDLRCLEDEAGFTGQLDRLEVAP